MALKQRWFVEAKAGFESTLDQRWNYRLYPIATGVSKQLLEKIIKKTSRTIGATRH